MTEALTPDLCIIGAGSGGLSVAAGAVQMGAAVVLVEKGLMGGDCLNTGCVPSKSLLAAAHAADRARAAVQLGVTAPPQVDFDAVRRHVAGVIASIAPHDSVERFEKLGVTVIRGHAVFTGRAAVEAAGQTIRARRFVIATGSRPATPPIPGLAAAPYLTNETIFNLPALPPRLLIVGGGAIGCELAQAFAGLGSTVTLVEAATLLGREDPDLARVVAARLGGSKIDIHERTSVENVAVGADRIVLMARPASGRALEFAGSHLLVAVGRCPSVNGLGLDVAGVAHTAAGITVDRHLKTTNPRIFAIGDCAGGPQLTHVAGYHAGIVVRQALFRLQARVDERAIPRVTYTNPELAQVGLTEAEARARHGDGIRVLTSAFADNDRARAEGDAEGMIKAITTRRGRILGAGIVGRAAGEIIQPWVLAINAGLGIGAMASMIAPYPTYGEINKRAAGSFFTPTLFGDRTKRIVRWLARLG